MVGPAVSDVRDKRLIPKHQHNENRGAHLDLSLLRLRIVLGLLDNCSMGPLDHLIEMLSYPILLGNPTRLRDELGWTAAIPLEQTVDDLLEYWRRKNP